MSAMFARDKARRPTPKGISELGSSSEAAVRCNKNHFSLASPAGNEIMSRQKNHALLASLAGNQFMHPSVCCREENYAPLRHWQVTKSCPVLNLPDRNLVREGTWLCKASRLASFRDEQFQFF